MASSLKNLHRTLTWKDFTPKDLPAPQAGQTSFEAAQTGASVSTTGLALEKASGGFRIRDSIVVTIVLNASQTWVAKWMLNNPQSQLDALLVHEQGHYDITALSGRDLYNALTALVGKTYSSAGAAQADINAAQGPLASSAQPISDRYDTDTTNGKDATKQGQWNGYIQTAFGQSGSTFLSVLAAAGITP